MTPNHDTPTIVPHGTIDYGELRELGFAPEDITIFSSNINPYGPPAEVVEALQEVVTASNISRYPDRLSLDLRDGLAELHEVDPENILVGNGTADIMWLLGLAFMQHRRVAIVSPTFGEYANVARLMQSTISEPCHPGWLRTGDSFHPGDHPLHAVARDLEMNAPEAVFLCNPNNPTGRLLTHQQLDMLHAAAPHALWVVDEAYAEFMAERHSSVNRIQAGNWLVLRSMTKDFALGGLRLGYVMGSREHISRLQAVQPPWNVNIMAQFAANFCLHSLEWRAQILEKLRQDTSALHAGLQQAGYTPLPSVTNFFLVPVVNGTALRRALLEKGLILRDCTSFGMPDYVRIATQLPENNDRLIRAMATLAPEHARPLEENVLQ